MYVLSATEILMSLPYPAPANPQSSSAETGGLRKPYGLVPGISGMAFPAFCSVMESDAYS